MKNVMSRTLMSAFCLLVIGTTLWAQADPFGDDPFGDDTLPKPDTQTVPRDDKPDLGERAGDGPTKPAASDPALPEGLFGDKPKDRDPRKAPRDGGAATIRGVGSSRSATVDFDRGMRLMEDGEWQDAIEYLDDAIQADPKLFKAYLARAEAHTRLAGETVDETERTRILDEAIADCNAALKVQPRSKEAYLARGVAERLQNGFKRANLSFTSAIELDRQFAEALLRRGIVLFYLNENEIAPAVFDFDNVIRLNPKDYRAHLWRGLLYSRNAEYDQAIESFNQALDANPDFAPALANRGLAYMSLSNLENALVDFTALAEVAKDDKTAPFKLGVVQSELGRYDDAVDSFSDAIALDPTYADAFYNRSIAHAEIDEYDKSDADYKEAVRLNSELRD